jgi:chromosome segregation ATPase
MAKETQREKIERLERELEQVTKQRDEVFLEVSALRRQINAAVEDTDAYKSIVAALQEEELKVKVARHSSELTEKMNRQLRNVNAELQEKYDAAVTSYNALRSKFDTLAIQSKANGEETLKNARGAGRKAVLSKEAQEEVRDMHRLGMSYREIAKKIGVSFSVVARACQREEEGKN